MTRVLFAGWLAVLAAVLPTFAASQATPPPPALSVDGPGDKSGASGDDFLRPLNQFQVTFGLTTAPGAGSANGTTRVVTTHVLNLRTDQKFVVAPGWTLTVRGDLPLVAKNPINSDNPDGHYLYGLGDSEIRSEVAHDLGPRWTIGFGARLTTPTAEDGLGTGKWQITPIAAVRYSLPEIGDGSYFEPLARYAYSFAGDPTRRNIRTLQFAPTLVVALPDRWFVTLYPSPDIRWNSGDAVTGQTGRLFLPFDVRIGRLLSKTLAVSVEASVPIIRDYPVYDFKSEVRLRLLY